MVFKKQNRPAPEARSIDELKQMSGTDFAMEVARDLVFLAKDERGRAIRMLTVLNDTVTREMEAPAR